MSGAAQNQNTPLKRGGHCFLAQREGVSAIIVTVPVFASARQRSVVDSMDFRAFCATAFDCAAGEGITFQNP